MTRESPYFMTCFRRVAFEKWGVERVKVQRKTHNAKLAAKRSGIALVTLKEWEEFIAEVRRAAKDCEIAAFAAHQQRIARNYSDEYAGEFADA